MNKMIIMFVVVVVIVVFVVTFDAVLGVFVAVDDFTCVSTTDWLALNASPSPKVLGREYFSPKVKGAGIPVRTDSNDTLCYQQRYLVLLAVIPCVISSDTLCYQQ